MDMKNFVSKKQIMYELRLDEYYFNQLREMEGFPPTVSKPWIRKLPLYDRAAVLAWWEENK